MSVRVLNRDLRLSLGTGVYGVENFTTAWTQWTPINNKGSASINSGVGSISGPDNSGGSTQYQTRRVAFTAPGAKGDMLATLDFMFSSLQEQYMDIAIRAQSTANQDNPKGVFLSFYPGSGEGVFSMSDSDGQYTANEVKHAMPLDSYEANVWYTVKIRVRGKRVSAKIWRKDKQNEPYSYLAWSSQGSVQGTTGYLALGITNGYSTTGRANFRNIRLEAPADELGDTTQVSGTTPPPLYDTIVSSDRVWQASYVQDFPTSIAEGGFRTAYPSIASYTEEQGDTGSGVTGGRYSTNKTVSVVGGVLTVNQRVIGGVPYGAMILADNYQGHMYGRAVFRARQTDVAGKGGFKFVPLWWPVSNNWDDGEIDWPEADNGGTPRPATASVPPTYQGEGNDRAFYPGIDVFADFDTSGWHEYAVDWSDSAITFYQDGRVVLRMQDPRGIPTTPMRFGFQMETWLGQGAVPAGAAGRVEIDWYAIYDPYVEES